MKRRYIFLVIIVLLIALYIYFKNKPVDYSLTYTKNEFDIEEKYNKDLSIYTFKLTKDKYIFYYALNHKYVSNRKLVSKINTKQLKNGDICLNINAFDKKQNAICTDSNEYYLNYKLLNEESKEVESTEDVKIYKNYSIYEWNHYGLTDLSSNKKYKVLSKESYDNSLSYFYKNYIIFANYDEKNEFSNFYIFNIKTNKMCPLKLKNKISFNSYFEGIYDNEVYLFDIKNSVQYSINLNKNSISITSDEDGAVYFNGTTKSQKSLKDFKYKNLIFKTNDVYNYYINNNNLYFKYYNSDLGVKIFENVDQIISCQDNKVVFLSEGEIYLYDINKGYYKVASSLEWEFHYENQIFVYGY